MHYLGIRHKHERTKQHQAEKPTAYTRLLDKITLIVGVIGPFTVIPQIYGIFSTQSATDVSLSTWFLMFIVNLPWIFYGLAHKDKTLVSSFILWGIVNISVVVGVLIYS